ncbi:beta-galactosidase family protein [Streptomyces sp. NPDC097619]|uniref:glycoside hydrolase family 35 protein n=1 Tax=Streptomyces sp. NPDC097619 TaxID=3157228 RepID=UPI003321E2AD
MNGFRVRDDHFELDGRPVRLLSGALHYFRVHEDHWPHRLALFRALGLDCVETYVPWNLHEPSPGRYRDPGAIGRFLDAVHASGLRALVRPGPYICAEWENGGLPHWVTGPLGRRVRTRDPEFLRHVEAWFAELLPHVTARQADTPGGGPVLMVQVENEYGSYGSDPEYLRLLADVLRRHGVTVPLFTSDGPEDHMLTGGSLPGVLASVNFGSGARGAFETLRRHRPGSPLLCAEFWCGWFDHWGSPHTGRDPEEAAAELREVLATGASVNLYMAHGGSNPDGWAGANREGPLHDGRLRPVTTSYDYDAPIDEYGRPTAKFHAFRSVLRPHAAAPPPPPPPAPPALTAPAEAGAPLWTPLDLVLDGLGGPETTHGAPPTFEELDVDRGLVRYRLTVPGPRAPLPLTVSGLRDLALVYVDGVRAGTLTEDRPELPEPVAGPARIELWTESLGRVNYGPRLGETKGVTGGVRHERQYLHGISATPLRLDAFEDADRVRALPGRPDAPPGARGLYRASITVTGPGDAALLLPGWTRGFAWINGRGLGRYWNTGPQDRWYVPGPLLREGANELWLLELDEAPQAAAGTPAHAGPGAPPGARPGSIARLEPPPPPARADPGPAPINP